MESKTHDLVELVRQSGDPANHRDYDALMRVWAPGSEGSVQIRFGSVSIWTGGLIERATNYCDIGDARAAAERLAEERG
jgi:hypothetical protein